MFTSVPFKNVSLKFNKSKIFHILPLQESGLKFYIPLSLVHLIYTAGDKCMRQNAC